MLTIVKDNYYCLGKPGDYNFVHMTGYDPRTGKGDYIRSYSRISPYKVKWLLKIYTNNKKNLKNHYPGDYYFKDSIKYSEHLEDLYDVRVKFKRMSKFVKYVLSRDFIDVEENITIVYHLMLKKSGEYSYRVETAFLLDQVLIIMEYKCYETDDCRDNDIEDWMYYGDEIFITDYKDAIGLPILKEKLDMDKLMSMVR